MNSILTVLVPGSQDLVDLATVRDELDVKSGSTVTLQRKIRNMSAAVASAANRVLMAETVRELIRSTGNLDNEFWIGHRVGPRADGLQRSAGDPVILNRFPVISISTITEEGNVFGDDTPLVDGTDYEVDAARGLIYRLRSGFRSPWQFTKLTIEYRGGFTTATLPGDVQEAALQAITGGWSSKGRDPALRQYSVPGVLEEQFWVGAPLGPNGLPPAIEAFIDNYREVPV